MMHRIFHFEPAPVDSIDRRAMWAGALTGFCATAVGFTIAAIGPALTTVILAAVALGIWMIWRLEHALWSIVAIVVLLPYATIPIKVLLTLSFLDIAVLTALTLYVLEWITGERRRLSTTPVHPFVLMFMLLSGFSFVAGLRYAGLTSNRLRQFAELLSCISFGLLLADMIDDEAKLESLIRVVVCTGLVAAVVGVTFWALPSQLTTGVLSKLSVVGYPGSSVVHYIEDNPALAERAIGTSVDPNSFGGMLIIVASITAGQLVSDKPVLGSKFKTLAVLGLILLCLGLTFSRGAMLAFIVAIAFIGVAAERRIIVVLIVGCAVALLLPFSQSYIQRFISGVQGTDLATQMRFGEYKDALVLIQRYPIIGVGFTGTPDIDIYLGVSSLYLTVASNMGLVGLASFVSVIIATLLYARSAYPLVAPVGSRFAIWVGLVAAVIAILVSGIFDHYFFNLEFFHASILFWTCIGTLLAIVRLARKSSAVAPSPI